MLILFTLIPLIYFISSVYGTNENITKYITPVIDLTKPKPPPRPWVDKIQIHRHMRTDGRLISPITRFEIAQYMRYMYKIPVVTVDIANAIKTIGIHKITYNNGRSIELEVVEENRF